ncbi:MAG TPA: hypothetical protein VM598_01030 [Bdellovibrionota bacterium]|nr:hypothetical protein [Bdellovibrionota bacterium]
MMTTRNVAFIALLGLATQLSTSFAMADGKFRMSLQGRTGFSLLNLTEQDGFREGVLDGTYAASVRDGDMFVMQIGQAVEQMEVTVDGKYTLYSGFLHGKPSRITSVPYKDGFYVYGDVGGTEFRVSVDQKKGNLFMYWPYNDELEFLIDINKNPQTAGACKGMMHISGPGVSEEIAKVFCTGEGSLADTFFNNPEDVIAYLVHLNVFPDDNDDWLRRFR